MKSILHVSGDGLRLVEDETKGAVTLFPMRHVPKMCMFFSLGLILDQTIEKVSFCAPDRKFSNSNLR